MCKSGGCISTSSKSKIDTTYITNMADLTKLQLKSQDGDNYNVLELRKTFIMIASSTKTEFVWRNYGRINEKRRSIGH